MRPLLEIRQKNLIIQQGDNSCGAEALATILTYDKGYPIPEQQVAQGMLRQTDALKVRHRGGFSLLDIQQYAKILGFQAGGYTNMKLDDFATQAPMIVPSWVRAYDHFLIVRRLLDITFACFTGARRNY